MEPPSQELERTLTSLGLATPADLRRCRARMKRLIKGLPAYDSVWIDALTATGAITPFQAKFLDSHRAEQLRIDEWILRSSRVIDPTMSLYEARHQESKRPALVTRVQCLQGEPEAAELRLQKVVALLQQHRSRVPLAPLRFSREGTEFSIISPFEQGESLSRFLVRRGRFPEEVVWAIALDLIKQLTVAEALTVHGDLRLSNIWLTPDGRLLLWNWGVLSSLASVISIQTPLPDEAYDGLAPERIDSSRPANLASDVYSLGCLLWQLLAGRPPFAMADSLAKMTAHRSRTVPDVRSIASETSEKMALLIRSMTAREAHRRPQTFSEIRASLEKRGGADRRRLQQFVHSFESAAPRRVEMGRPSRKPANRLATAALFTVGALGIAGVVWNRDALNLPGISRVNATTQKTIDKPLLDAQAEETALSRSIPEKTELTSLPPIAQLASNETALIPEIVQQNVIAEHNADGLRSFPAPSETGEVFLEQGVYRASELSHSTVLLLRAAADQPAVILVEDDSLLLKAPRIVLENVSVVHRPQGGVKETFSPVRIHSQELHLKRCRFESPESVGPESFFFHWESVQPGQPNSGRLLVLDSVFSHCTAILSVDPLTTVRVENSFKQGTGALLELVSGVASGMIVPLVMNHCTLENSGPVVRFSDASSLASSGRLSIRGQQSVFDIAEGRALVEFVNEGGLAEGWEQHVEILAEGMMISLESWLVGECSAADVNGVSVETSGMTVDGLLSGQFHFDPVEAEQRGGVSRVIVDSLPIQLSAQPPGADVERFLSVPEVR